MQIAPSIGQQSIFVQEIIKKQCLTHKYIYYNCKRSTSKYQHLLRLVLLKRRFLGHRCLFIRIDGEQRQQHGGDREQHCVRQHHGDIVLAERVQRPGAGQQRTGEDLRQRQSVNAALADDVGLEVSGIDSSVVWLILC